MKLILLFFTMLMVALSVTAYPQDRTKTKTTPANYGWTMIYGEDGGRKQFVGADTSDAFLLTEFAGANTLWFDPDTVGCGAPDSCLTVSLLLRNKNTGQWGAFYTGARLDTVARSVVNVPAGANSNFYMNLPVFNNYQWADSAKIAYGIAADDSLNLASYVGGQ